MQWRDKMKKMFVEPHLHLVSMRGEMQLALDVTRCGRNRAGRVCRIEHLGRQSYGHPNILVQLFADLEILVRRFKLEYELETQRIRARRADGSRTDD